MAVTSDACAALDLNPDSLGEAERLGLVTIEQGRVRFRHPLRRAAIQARADGAVRRAVHRAVAGALPIYEQDRRAWHLADAVWYPDGGVAELLVAAGERARTRAAHAVASRAFERAAQLSPDAAQRSSRLLRAARSAWVGGQGQRALDLLGRLGPLPPSEELDGLELRAEIAARTGSLREAVEIPGGAPAMTTDDRRRFCALTRCTRRTTWATRGWASP